jgi:hypothetical protein
MKEADRILNKHLTDIEAKYIADKRFLYDSLINAINEALAISRVMPRFSSEQVELNKKAIESAIAICDWDNYDKDKYKSPKEQITDMYWLIENLNGA